MHPRAQSAAEYLMTYSWAILIIAIAIAGLYELGIFNPYTFVAKSATGSCTVERPNGPFTTSGATLSGACTELPDEVAEFSGTSYIATPTALLNNLSDFTVSFWVDPASSSNEIVYEEGYADCPLLTISGSPLTLNVSNHGTIISSYITGFYLKANSWQFITVTLTGGGPGVGTATFYINGDYDTASVPSQSESRSGGTLSGLIGGTSLCPGIVGGFRGEISNVQVYNTSLSQNGVVALYQEGIGGAPIDLSNLDAWWPLNGDSSDYSGNNYNGNATSVSFTAAWTKDYSGVS